MRVLTAMLLMAAATPIAAQGIDPNFDSRMILAAPNRSFAPFDTPSWVPDEATKKRALMRAYELNGNSMVGHMIDVSDDQVVHDGMLKFKTDGKDWDVTKKQVKTQSIIVKPVDFPPPHEKNTLDAIADLTDPEPAKADICKRHHMRKVTTGNSWRCRK